MKRDTENFFEGLKTDLEKMFTTNTKIKQKYQEF